MRISKKHKCIVSTIVVALAVLAAEPAWCQQDNSQTGASQMPPNQGGTTTSTSGTPLQPSEIEEQQIEQQQQSQQQPQPPG